MVHWSIKYECLRAIIMILEILMPTHMSCIMYKVNIISYYGLHTTNISMKVRPGRRVDIFQSVIYFVTKHHNSMQNNHESQTETTKGGKIDRDQRTVCILEGISFMKTSTCINKHAVNTYILDTNGVETGMFNKN